MVNQSVLTFTHLPLAYFYMVSQSVLTFTQSALAYFYMVCQPVLTFTQSAPVYFYMASQSVLTFTQSAADHLVRFDSYICNAFAKKEHVLAIFFDLEKAYDTTWKYAILSNLYDLIFEAICLLSLMGFCLIDCSRLELGPLCLIRMNRRWMFLKAAYCLHFFSVLKLTILSSQS